ncbi:MAG: DUF2284 domain-containing protein [Candidatus Riflebacteria bacterium]|nr:DUF2284 domain-containing protein [Candidatus Riflebacteria bacterium]
MKISEKIKTEEENMFETYIKKAVEYGATSAKVIDCKTIVTAPWVRMKCQFGCGGYNSSHCCPPNTPTPEETQKVINCFKRAILVHCQGKRSPSIIVSKLERVIFLSGFYKVFAFGAGPCNLCRKCKEDGCRHPESARPAMEACGIDVYATARANEYPISVLKDESCEGNYFGLILID